MSRRHRVATIVVLFFTTLLSLDTADAGLFRHRRCRQACVPCAQSSSEKMAVSPLVPCSSDQVCPQYTTEPPSNPDPVLYYAMKCTMPPTPVPWYGQKGHPPGSCNPCTNCEPPTRLFLSYGKHAIFVEDKVVNDGISVVGPLDPAKAFRPDKPGVTVTLNSSRLIKFEHFNKTKEPKTVVAQFFDVTFTDPEHGAMRAVFAREVVEDPKKATAVKAKKHNTKHAFDITVEGDKDSFTLITNTDTLDTEKP